MSEPKDAEWQKSTKRFQNKRHSEYFDPCQEAANRSLKCLRRNEGDKSLCADYFQAYKDCKKQWVCFAKEWGRD
ncbi:mitochondrial cytochrome c oxidase assembly factor [Piedraia hortae CBS 480.64]|uniref:Cytochrome c oxidase-assembly factor COX23, mitochondrial n=1 Tax=Piedraia hortae CBS 480.64 TaxID=1314780 RepID=A0A6A7BTF1_9PEZI|nr:mitochondrial cytochrome c oxidase assembly factor [Piedraia hortae CBS 480.64]